MSKVNSTNTRAYSENPAQPYSQSQIKVEEEGGEGGREKAFPHTFQTTCAYPPLAVVTISLVIRERFVKLVLRPLRRSRAAGPRWEVVSIVPELLPLCGRAVGGDVYRPKVVIPLWSSNGR